MTHSPYRIVVGTDFSQTADVAVEQAFCLASREAGGEVHVLNAVQHLGEFVQMELPHLPAYRLPLEEAQERLEAQVGAQLAEWQTRTEGSISRCVTYVSVDFPAVALGQLAKDLEADLVVVGTHGRRGVRRFLLGSVAEAVVRLSDVPVLVVRPRGQADEPSATPACPDCVRVRKTSEGKRLWCIEHEQKHAHRPLLRSVLGPNEAS